MLYSSHILIAGMVTLPLSCTSGHPNASERISGNPQAWSAAVISPDLVKRAHSSVRDEWYPAVDQLGALARTDENTLKAVWSRASVNSLGMKFVEIKPGFFVMGPAVVGGAAAVWHPASARNAHRVEITRGFFMSVTEVTNAQFALLFPHHKPHPRSPLPDSPAIAVTWEQAVEFCRLLSEREGGAYRLPTEAEWEYACRAGSTTTFCFGDDPVFLGQYAWYGKYHDNAAPVASLKPNGWGLYDMHGNALEWTSDWYRPDTYQLRAEAEVVTRDPQGPPSGSAHVLRGGDWACWEPSALASSKRTTIPMFPLYIELLDRKFPKTREVAGFRLVSELDE